MPPQDALWGAHFRLAPGKTIGDKKCWIDNYEKKEHNSCVADAKVCPRGL